MKGSERVGSEFVFRHGLYHATSLHYLSPN